MLDRSTILKDAHARVRWARALVTRNGGKQDPYRVTFAWCLRDAWSGAKDLARQAASNAALSALEEIEDADPTNYAARVAALRAFAETMPLHSVGREQRRKIMADADDLAQAARLIPFTAPEPAYHAH